MASVVALGASSAFTGGAVATGDGFGTAVAGGFVGCGTGVEGRLVLRPGGRRLGASWRTTRTETEGS